MKLTFVLNNDAGAFDGHDTDHVETRITQPFRDAGYDVDLISVSGSELSDTLEDRRDRSDVLFAVGGDGSIATAAQTVAGSDTALGVLPFGTMNLVARDLGMGQWTDDLGRRLANGHRRLVDVGWLDDRIFLHSVLLGAFADLAGSREALRAGRSPLRWPSFLTSVSENLLADDVPIFDILLDGRHHHLATRSLMISNNKITDRSGLGLSRDALDKGKLYLYAPRDRTRLATLGTLLRFATGRWNRNPRLKRFKTKSGSIDTPARSLHVTIDGEIHELTTPLDFRIEPKGLKLWVPSE